MARSRRQNQIPSLDDNNPRDTGSRYMIARDRFLIAEKFGYLRKQIRQEYPTKADQEMMLLALKTEDPEKYKKWYDIYVRGVEPEQEVVVEKVELPPEMMKEAKDALINHCQTLHDDLEFNYKNHIKNLGEVSSSVTLQVDNWKKHFSDYIRKKVDEESKKLNQIEIVVKTPKNKTIKIEDPIPEQFDTVIDLVSQRVNTLLVGPSGCGKTKLAYMVAEACDADFSAQSCSAGMSESAFSGWLLPIADNGRFVYVQSEFVRIYENGGIFLFDEIDAADSNTLLFLNQALANNRFYLPQRHEKPLIKRHKDFIPIAAANTYGNGATALYSGRNILDAATMDRFRMGIVPMDYSPVVEEKLIDPLVLEWGRMVRKIIYNKNLRKIMSTRLLLDATKMKNNANWNFNKISKAYFSDWSKEEKRIIIDNKEYSHKYIYDDNDVGHLTQDQKRNIIEKAFG